ncbi:DUF1125 domain-containing protein [Lactococcus petauri]|uniref:DUF1125 domain-containing protein n=1 Tax=Lactococcus petauri TaxID=1940789 RepID=UPI0018AC5124|nr:DUF1125 domain-containing protein [Lactococcus petauri]MDC0826076.1 DUF1125 domain-containing protein [Lactococcus petauri]
MTVKNLLEALTEDAVVAFQDSTGKITIRFEYGQDIDVFSVNFQFRKIVELKALHRDSFLAVLED